MRYKLTAILFTLFLALSAGARQSYAQSPSPTPIVVNPGKIADTFTQLSMSAVKFLEFMRNEVEAPLNEYFFLLALVVFSGVACAAFLRMKDANNGALDALLVLRFIMRFAMCAFVMTVILVAADKMLLVGNWIAYGQASNTGNVEFNQSWLGKLASDQQETFEESYSRYLQCLFIVKVNGQPTDLTDPGDGTVTLLGVTKDQGLNLAGTTMKALQDNKWDPNEALQRLNWGRLAIAVGNLFNAYLPHLLLLLMRLFAPFAVAVAIDKGLAARLTWQWIWGMVSLSIILPPLSQVLRIAAYVAGNLALQVGDPAPIWNWDYATMSMLKSSPGDPAQLVNMAFITMLVMAFMLMASVVIAYQITYGKVYETGSNLISAAIFGGSSVGIGAVSAVTAASISRQAEVTQITGQSRAEGETLRGQKESADIRDTGGAVAGRAASKSSAYQGAALAESGSVATIERARSTYEKTVRETEATHQRTETESQGRTEASDVEAQNAANQARSGMSGTIVDAGKGIGRWLTGEKSPASEGEQTDGNGGMPTTGQMLGQVGSLGGGAYSPPQPTPTEEGVGGSVGKHSAGQQYGAPRDYDGDGVKDEHHTGLDYGRAEGFYEGTRVGSAAKGRVIFAGKDGGYGNRVVVDHGNGVVTSYSHLEDDSINNIAVGQELQRGAVIGRVGHTGGKYDPHLHFETGTLAGGTDKYGAPNMEKVSPATTSYRPFNLGKGVDGGAAMPTQAGQAMRESSRLREQATLNASEDYRAAIIGSSEIARDEEIGISGRQAARDASINWTAHGMRVAGIDAQEKMNLRANSVMFDHGMRAMEERRNSSLDAAAIREKAAVVSAVGSAAAQSVSRFNEAFRF